MSNPSLMAALVGNWLACQPQENTTECGAKPRRKKSPASNTSHVVSEDALLRFEEELKKWAASIGEIASIEATKAFLPIIYGDDVGLGMLGKNEVPIDSDAVRSAAMTVARRVEEQAIRQLFFDTGIPSMLAKQSRKHGTTKAGSAERPRSKALYKQKIRELLEGNPEMDNPRLIARLESDQWISDDGDGWSVETSMDDQGQIDNARPTQHISSATMTQSISSIRTEMKRQSTSTASHDTGRRKK